MLDRRIGVFGEDSPIYKWSMDSLAFEEFRRIFASNSIIEAPEKKLMLGVLEDALYHWTINRRKSYLSSSEQVETNELKVWLNSPETDYLFSFNNICDELGLSATWLRELCFGIRKVAG